MRRIVLALALAACALTAGATAAPKDGHCAWCPRYPCYGQGSCPSPCFCLIPSGTLRGSCVSTD